MVGVSVDRASARTVLAAPGSVTWFTVTAAFGVVWVPWLITGWRVDYPASSWRVAQAFGLLVIVAGALPVASTFVWFVRAAGTPIPGAFTRELVVRGCNRYVRNPIYLGVLAIIVGEALLLGQWRLLVYAMGVWLLVAWFVRGYEEPALDRRFGEQYAAYRRAVPTWRPRLHPWPGPPSGD